MNQKLRWNQQQRINGKQINIPALKINMAPENCWLEDDVSFWDGPFSGVMFVFGSVEPTRYSTPKSIWNATNT